MTVAEKRAKQAAYMRRWRQENPEKARANDRAQAQKKRDRDPEKFLAAVAERQRRYRARHPERIKALNAREDTKERKRRWAAEHPDVQRLYYERTREQQRANRARYYQENRDKFMAHSRKRKALMRGAAGTFTPEQVRARFEFHGNRCIYCGRDDKLTIDHLIPVTRGGSNWPANLAPACETCNARKYTKTYFEFMAARAA